MKIHCFGIVILAATLNLGVPQSQTPQPNTRSAAPPTEPRGIGQLIVDVLPVPQSLKELTDMSTLIIEGVVSQVIPPRGDGRTWIETDSIINIAQIFKGSAGGSAIVVAQMGGRVGDVTSQPMQYSLVQPGERYILFLTSDDRTSLPSVAGLKRYDVTAAWAGLLFIGANNLVHTDAKYPDVLRKQYEGKSKVEMIDLLRQAVNRQ